MSGFSLVVVVMDSLLILLKTIYRYLYLNIEEGEKLDVTGHWICIKQNPNHSKTMVTY